MKLLTLLLSLALIGCSTTIPPPNGEMNWFLANGTGSDMVMVVYDRVCKRNYFRIALPRTGEVAMTTCKDSAGRADIRYRRNGRIAEGNPWRDARMTEDQVLVVR